MLQLRGRGRMGRRGIRVDLPMTQAYVYQDQRMALYLWSTWNMICSFISSLPMAELQMRFFCRRCGTVLPSYRRDLCLVCLSPRLIYVSCLKLVVVGYLMLLVILYILCVSYLQIEALIVLLMSPVQEGAQQKGHLLLSMKDIFEEDRLLKTLQKVKEEELSLKERLTNSQRLKRAWHR